MKLPKKKLLRPDEVADRLDVSINTVYKMIREGKIEALRVGRILRVRVCDVEAYMTRHSTTNGG